MKKIIGVGTGLRIFGMAVISEDLRRLNRLGPVVTFVGSGSQGASAFYKSTGFDRCDVAEMWTKDL